MAFGSFSKMLEKMLPPHSSKAIEAPNLDAKDDPWHRPFVLQMPQHPQAALKHDPGHKTLVLTPRPKNEVILSATLDGLVDLQDEQKVLDSFDRAVFADPAQNLAPPSRVALRSCRLRASSPAPSSVYSRLPDAVPGKSLRDRVDSGVVAGTPVDSRQDYAPDYSHTSERRCANYASKADGETAGGSAVDSLQGSKSVSGSHHIVAPYHKRSDHDWHHQAKRPALHVEIPVEGVAAAHRPIAFDSAMDIQESMASPTPETLAHLESRLRHLRKTNNRRRNGRHQNASRYNDSTRCVQPLDEAAALIKEIRYMLGLPVADLVKHCIHSPIYLSRPLSAVPSNEHNPDWDMACFDVTPGNKPDWDKLSAQAIQKKKKKQGKSAYGNSKKRAASIEAAENWKCGHHEAKRRRDRELDSYFTAQSESEDVPQGRCSLR
ncbi:hypothetical protein Slin14017_G109720 [Septoria linicola]|nr:hypothetical protein Slin14017_G109720 [Septoria linicola]